MYIINLLSLGLDHLISNKKIFQHYNGKSIVCSATYGNKYSGHVLNKKMLVYRHVLRKKIYTQTFG